MSGIAGQAFTVVIGRILTRAAQFVTFVILARFLSPSDFGWYGLLTTAISLAALLGGLGLRQSVAYWIGQNRITSGEGVATVLAAWAPLALASVAVLILLYGNRSSVDSGILAWTIGISVAGALLINLLQGVNLGRGHIGAYTTGENLPRTLLMVGAVALLIVSQVTLENALIVQALGFAITVPVILWFAVRGVGPLKVKFRQIGPMVGYGIVFALNLFFLMLGARLSMFIIGATHDAAEAGRFFAAVRVNEIFLEVAAALGMVLFANAARQDRSVSVVGRNARISCWMLWFFALGAIFVALLAPLMIQLLAGSQYSGAGPALQILAIGLAPAAASKLIYPTLAGSGHPFFGTPVIVVSLLSNCALALLLVPPLGPVGGAVALVVGQYMLYFGYVLVCARKYDVSVRDFLIPRMADLRAIRSTASSKVRAFIAKFRK